jgi:hypothetical protein
LKIMLLTLRRNGIGFGCIVATWLAVSLVAGFLLGSGASVDALVWPITLLLGGLIYREIISREQRST